MTVVKFVGALKKSGGIPRSEKWNIPIKGTDENVESVLPEMVRNELEFILEKLEGKEFLIIGGTAVVAYVPYRVTIDVDVLTHYKSGVNEIMKNTYEQYREPTVGEVSTYFFKGRFTHKVHLMLTSTETFDITWAHNAREVSWHGHKFLIPHIDTLAEMKKLSGRAVDGEDAEALRHWRRLWLGGKTSKKR